MKIYYLFFFIIAIPLSGCDLVNLFFNKNENTEVQYFSNGSIYMFDYEYEELRTDTGSINMYYEYYPEPIVYNKGTVVSLIDLGNGNGALIGKDTDWLSAHITNGVYPIDEIYFEIVPYDDGIQCGPSFFYMCGPVNSLNISIDSDTQISGLPYLNPSYAVLTGNYYINRLWAINQVENRVVIGNETKFITDGVTQGDRLYYYAPYIGWYPNYSTVQSVDSETNLKLNDFAFVIDSTFMWKINRVFHKNSPDGNYIYNQGSIALVEYSNVISGTNTAWNNSIQVGDIIVIEMTYRSSSELFGRFQARINKIDSDTNILIDRIFPFNPIGLELTYKIIHAEKVVGVGTDFIGNWDNGNHILYTVPGPYDGSKLLDTDFIVNQDGFASYKHKILQLNPMFPNQNIYAGASFVINDIIFENESIPPTDNLARFLHATGTYYGKGTFAFDTNPMDSLLDNPDDVFCWTSGYRDTIHFKITFTYPVDKGVIITRAITEELITINETPWNITNNYYIPKN